MKSNSKININDSGKDDKDYSDKESNDDNLNDDSKINDAKVIDNDQINTKDQNGKLKEDFTKEKEDTKWSKIDWTKNASEEIKETKFSKIDWNKNISEEEKDNKWRKINWNKKYCENEKNVENKYEKSKDISMDEIEDSEKKDFHEKKINEEFELEEIKNEDKKLKPNYKPEGIESEDEKFISNYDLEDSENNNRFKNSNHMSEHRDDEVSDFTNKKFESNHEIEEILESKHQEDMINIHIKDYDNLLNKELQNNLNEYLNQTGIYANWGVQITQNFVKKIQEKIKDNTISEDEKNSLEGIKQICEDINTKHEIQSYIVGLKRNNDFSNQQISKELRKIGLNVSRNLIGKIVNLQTSNDVNYLTKDTKWSFLDWSEKGKQLSYEEQVEKASLFLKSKILTNQFKEKYQLEINEGPKKELLDIDNKGFTDACMVRKIHYNDILRDAGLKINMERNKWTFLDRNESGKQLSYKEQVEKAAEFLNDKILTPRFKEKYQLKTNEGPKREILSIDNKGFTNACSLRKIYYNDILRETGLKINMERNKWTFLDRNESGKQLSYKEQVEKAAEYLNDKILTPRFKEKFDLKNNEGPMRSILEVENYDFVRAIGHRKISHNDVLRHLGLKLNMESGKWSFLDQNEKGESLSYEEQVSRASEYLKKKILTKDFRVQYNLGTNEGPTIEKLYNEFSDYISSVRIRGISYNDILINAGLNINYEHGKWEFLDRSDSGKALLYNEQIEKAGDFLKNSILTEDFRIKNNLGKDEGPTLSTLMNEHMDFCGAILNRNLLYNEILVQSGCSSHDLQIYSEIGKSMHWIEESIFLQHTRRLNCNSFYEIYPNIKTQNIDLFKKFGLKRCDNAIIIDNNSNKLSDELEQISESREDIKIINFDYFLGNSKQKIIDKCLKGYQSRNKMLILIPIHSSTPQDAPDGVPYRENIKIMDPKTFADFIGYRGELREKFFLSLNIAKNAVWNDDENRELLSQLSDESKHNIKKNYNHNQKELEKFVENTHNISKSILKYVPDKSTLDKWILNKKREEKKMIFQLTLISLRSQFFKALLK